MPLCAIHHAAFPATGFNHSLTGRFVTSTAGSGASADRAVTIAVGASARCRPEIAREHERARA